jgi:hypothetical protein
VPAGRSRCPLPLPGWLQKGLRPVGTRGVE